MNRSDSLEAYFKSVSDIPLLSRQQEIDLFGRLRTGDESARQQIAEANQRLVIKIAKSHLGRGLSFGDLIGEGNIGLMRAIEKFDLKKECRFATYAIHWIRQAVTRGVQEKAPMVRPPVDLTGMVPKYRKTVNELERKLGRRPHTRDVAKAMRMSAEKVSRLDKADRAWRGIKPLPEFESIDTAPVATTEEDASIKAGRQVEARDMVEVLMRAVSEREREILNLRFGLAGCPPMTLHQVGKRLNVTRARVGQIQSRALAKMGAAYEQSTTAADAN